MFVYIMSRFWTADEIEQVVDRKVREVKRAQIESATAKAVESAQKNLTLSLVNEVLKEGDVDVIRGLVREEEVKVIGEFGEMLRENTRRQDDKFQRKLQMLEKFHLKPMEGYVKGLNEQHFSLNHALHERITALVEANGLKEPQEVPNPQSSDLRY